jgi:hypothetical protein
LCRITSIRTLKGEIMRVFAAFLPLIIAIVVYLPQTTISTAQNAQAASSSDLFKQSKAAARRKDFTRAAELLEEVVARGRHDSGLLYDTACWWARAGNKEKAFHSLLESIQSGYHQAAHLQRDSDLLSLHDDPRWAKAVAACERQETKYVKNHSDPNKARFITADIARFWKAYDHAITSAPKDRAAIFQREYIDHGTLGLEDLNRIGRVDSEGLAKIIESYANYYKAIRQVTLDIEKQRAETVSAFRKLKELYPPASFPDTYFAIGHFEGGGTASNEGLLIGAEMYARAPGVPTVELDEWENSHAQAPSELPPVIAHEMVHFHQAYSSQESLLCKCLNEGSADFISELMVGRLLATIQKAHEWADPRERELWDEFQKEMNGTDISHWLYAGSGKGDRPTDLGYWMGYKIVEAYYRNATDKKQAIKDILMVRDCNEFVKASRYAEKFDPLSLLLRPESLRIKQSTSVKVSFRRRP